MLKNIINELKSLEGKEVGTGYFKKIYSNEVEEDIISTIDILESLLPYEISNQVSFKEYLEIEEYKEVKSDNTVNWSAPVSNDIDFKIYESNLYEGIIVELSIHKYGDLRCNYTDECYLSFNSEYEFYEVLLESNKDFIITKNDINYYITIDILNECPIINYDDEYLEGYEALNLLEELLER